MDALTREGRSPPTALIVGSDETARRMLTAMLAGEGIAAIEASNGHEALGIVSRERVFLLLIDIAIGGVSGLELLQEVRDHARGEAQPFTVLMTDDPSLGVALDARVSGAAAVLSKPVEVGRVRPLLASAAEVEAARSGQAMPLPKVDLGAGRRLVGGSEAMGDVRHQIAEAAGTDLTTLVAGETGTGKGLIARLIHDHSPRSKESFHAVHCGAMSDTLLDSELFGHVRGAFTGAEKDHKGYFERASAGTIFLDEIGDASPALQLRLLRVIEQGRFTPVGGDRERTTEARVIAATHRDLSRAVESGSFRLDLLHRLDLVRIEVPPLRERMQDLAELTAYLLTRAVRKHGLGVDPTVSANAWALLHEHTWPGNVRELDHCLTRAALRARGLGVITSHHITTRDRVSPIHPGPVSVRPIASPQLGTSARTRPDTGFPVRTLRGRIETMSGVERRHIRAVLELTNWNVKRAADLLGMKRGTLRSRMARRGIERPREAN